MVIGSMAPDFGYFFGRFDLATYAHTAAGSVVAAVPTGLLVYFVSAALRADVCYLLPQPHRSALMPLALQRPQLATRRIAVLVFSLLLGAWTHCAWDSFTHQNGWAVQRIAVLRDAALHVGGATVPAYHVLQHASTVVGTVVLVLAYRSWFRREAMRAPQATARGDQLTDAARWILLGSLATIAVAAAVPIAARVAAPFEGYFAARVFVFRAAVYSMAAFSGLLAAAALVLGRARRRGRD